MVFSVSRLQNTVLPIKKPKSIGGKEKERKIKEGRRGGEKKEKLEIETELGRKERGSSWYPLAA